MFKDKYGALLCKRLKTGMIRNNFIDGLNSNYEEYLTELINNSKFVNDNGNKKFKHIKHQNNGEHDAENACYAIDYKLLIDKNTMENMFLYSTNIRIDQNNVVAYCDSKKHGYNKRYNFIKVLRKYSKEDFKRIEISPKSELDEFEKIIKDFIGNIKINKNTLYYIPLDLYYENLEIDAETIKYIIDNYLKNDLKGFIDYRKEETNKDTYFCFISKDKIVFLKHKEELEFYDIVKLEKSKRYSELEELNDDLFA